MSQAASTGDPRLAELIGSLSLATDAAAGLAMETALRTCLLAVLLGRELRLQGQALSDIYYTGLLRFIGCTAYAHETAQAGAGDDQGLLRLLTPVDSASPREVAGSIVRGAGRGAPLLRRAGAVGRLLGDPALPRRLATAHCEQAMALSTRLGMSAAVVEALGQIYERFDGKGLPHKLRGEAISLPVRVMQVAWRVVVQSSLESPAHAVEAVRRRGGKELDPQIAAAFLVRPAEFLALACNGSVWEAFLDAEPVPVKRVRIEQIDGIADAFARYVDLKSPFTLEHSTGVARLTGAPRKRPAFQQRSVERCASRRCCTTWGARACRTASGTNPGRSTRWSGSACGCTPIRASESSRDRRCLSPTPVLRAHTTSAPTEAATTAASAVPASCGQRGCWPPPTRTRR